jgi:signal peptidase I
VIITTSEGKKIELEERYLPSYSFTEGNVDITLGKDEFYVLGDNRNYSYDSRQWGVLPKQDIIGKVFVRVWPISKAQAFLNEQFEPTS